jgi:hypothetical protein
MNTHAIIENLLGAAFSVRSLSSCIAVLHLNGEIVEPEETDIGK